MTRYPVTNSLICFTILLIHTSFGFCADELLLKNLTQLTIIELKAELDHVQGIAVDDESFWVTSVDRKKKTGHLHRFDSKTGEPINQVEVQDGECYHPGGLSLDGENLWIPVAAYSPESQAFIQCRDKISLKLINQFSVNDHIGCIAVNNEQIIGGNWDSIDLYCWDKTGRLIQKIKNPTQNHFQDIQFNNGQLIASGLCDKRGAIDWIDWETLKPIKRLWGEKTDREVNFMKEGMAVYNNKLFLLPEDGPSRVFVFQFN